jgi:sulfopyruvate decarboxylase TPP-binding subunit
MYQALEAEPGLELVPVCREGESVAIAAGLWAGGKTPVVLIQNTGMFESGDSIRGLGLDVNLPLVMMIGYRGWTRHGPTPDSAARFTEPILNAWGINYYLIESDADVERISLAFEEARRTARPVAVLVGREYG